SIVLRPDGRRALFVGSRGSQQSQIYTRSLDSAEAVSLAGTEGATAPFLSPDGEWVAFVGDGKIKKMPVAGGAVAAVCDLPAGPFWGASWGEDGIVLCRAERYLLRRVGWRAAVGDQNGGAAQRIRSTAAAAALTGRQGAALHCTARYHPADVRRRRAANAD